jgi:hypothetical protein
MIVEALKYYFNWIVTCMTNNEEEEVRTQYNGGVWNGFELNMRCQSVNWKNGSLKVTFLIQKTMGIVATFPEHTKKHSWKSHILHYLMQETTYITSSRRWCPHNNKVVYYMMVILLYNDWELRLSIPSYTRIISIYAVYISLVLKHKSWTS